MKYLIPEVSRRAPVVTAVTVLTLSLVSLVPASHANSTKENENGETNSGDYQQVVAPIVFRDGATHLRKIDNVKGVAFSEGDIILGDAARYFNREQNKQPGKRSALGLSNYVYGKVWPNGIVPYRVSPNLSDDAAQKVRTAIDSWNNTGAISLIERTATTESAYPNYIDFIDTDQCASWVGFQNAGPQSIYTGDQCSTGSMIHEIGHALGLLHEHTRPDRDSFVQVNWNSISADKAHNFDILDEAITLGEYDYDSIMHYGSHFFSSDGSATITPLDSSVQKIGQREYLSDGDRASIIALYQSEYALVTASSASAVVGETIQLDMFVTNNSDTGVNTLRLETTVPSETTLVSFSSPSWVCQQDGAGANVKCLSPALAQSDSSTVSVSLSAPDAQGEVSFESTLSANTADADNTNNQDSSSTLVVASADDLPVAANGSASAAAASVRVNTQPAFAAATPAEASSGGGSFPALAAALGILLTSLRRKRV